MLNHTSHDHFQGLWRPKCLKDRCWRKKIELATIVFAWNGCWGPRKFGSRDFKGNRKKHGAKIIGFKNLGYVSVCREIPAITFGANFFRLKPEKVTSTTLWSLFCCQWRSVGKKLNKLKLFWLIFASECVSASSQPKTLFLPDSAETILLWSLLMAAGNVAFETIFGQAQVRRVRSSSPLIADTATATTSPQPPPPTTTIAASAQRVSRVTGSACDWFPGLSRDFRRFPACQARFKSESLKFSSGLQNSFLQKLKKLNKKFV